MNHALLYDFNHASLWRGSISVWERRFCAASLDRLMFLALHRAGWMGAKEAKMLRQLVRPGMEVIDVGANLGLYSLLLAGLVGDSGRVYSFEPEPRLCAILRENCISNGITNVVPLEYAAGPSSARATFKRSAFNSGNNRLGHRLTDATAIEVTVVRIDDVIPAEKIDFVKIDVQGHEFGVLAGMERLLASSPEARVFFEFWPGGLRRAGSSAEELLSFFDQHGFAIFETKRAKLSKLNEPAKLIRQLAANGYTNLLASRDALPSDD